MNRHRVLFLCVVVLMIILAFFPYSTRKVISGYGEVITLESEKARDCTISIEICETKSLLFCYKKQFSYTLDGEKCTEFLTSSHSETDDGLCLIDQMFYDEQTDDLTLCSLVYSSDLSYAMIQLDTESIVYNLAR